MVDAAARCPLHAEPLRPRRVRVTYGLPADAFLEATRDRVPHAGIVLGGTVLGGCVVGRGEPTVEVPVCAACVQALRAWETGPGVST